MAYTINKTDGSILATVADGQIDKLSSDIILIGKNYSGFGESLNENFIKLLENFSNTSRPDRPIKGQLWFDSGELKLKVYNGLGFVPVSSATIANSQPLTLGAGDLFFHNVNKQLYFYDGVTAILLGPDYSASQGLSGLKVDSILDSLNQTRVITYLYTNGVLLGIFSKDSFTPKLPIDGFSGNISPGFNGSSLENLRFNVTVGNSDKLGNQPISSFVRTNTNNVINGQLSLSSNSGLIIGDANQGKFEIDQGNLIITNIAPNKNLSLQVRRGTADQEIAIKIEPVSRTINLYDGYIDSEVKIGGDATIDGNLTVNGTTTTVSSSTLLVEDKNIILADTGSPSDTIADGGGIILKGDTDHEFLWTDASSAWNSTEHINLALGREIKINGVTVVSANALGSGITSLPGVTSFGTQNAVNIGPGVTPVAQMRLENNIISTLSDNLDIQLSPNGTGNVALVGSPKITGMADPTTAQDATTKNYVDTLVKSKNLSFSMDISDGISNTEIAVYLGQIAPVGDHASGTLARILCSTVTISTRTLDINPLLTLTTAVFNQPSGTGNAVTNVSVATATVPSPTVSVNRVVKTFQIVGGAWTFIS
jgi:hypothetical protein